MLVQQPDLKKKKSVASATEVTRLKIYSWFITENTFDCIVKNIYLLSVSIQFLLE